MAEVGLKEKRIIITFDKDFLEKISNSLVIIFDFPKVHNEDILMLIEKFLEDLAKLKIPKSKILKFTKNGLEVVE